MTHLITNPASISQVPLVLLFHPELVKLLATHCTFLHKHAHTCNLCLNTIHKQYQLTRNHGKSELTSSKPLAGQLLDAEDEGEEGRVGLA